MFKEGIYFLILTLGLDLGQHAFVYGAAIHTNRYDIVLCLRHDQLFSEGMHA